MKPKCAEINIKNIPNINDIDQRLLVSKLSMIFNKLIEENNLDTLDIRVNAKYPNEIPRNQEKNEVNNEEDTEITKDINYLIQEPLFSFDQLILEEATMQELIYFIRSESVNNKVFNEWNLKKLEPFPKLALNFHGPSGTGKTMAAHALANKMQKKIILASYAEIESKYHGDGPKNVKKLFSFASENNCILFIDEADSLLSKRLTNVTQGSEQAINSMRSQLLIEIERFNGIVVFSTNLAENYDNAFITRIKSIKFNKPTQEMRKKLWDSMLLETLPLHSNTDTEKLSSIDDVCGRDIKNAIVRAAQITAIENMQYITHIALEKSINEILKSNQEIEQKDMATNDIDKEVLKRKIKKAIKRKNRCHY
jgi:AAA+ superfamily predicted ATPase